MAINNVVSCSKEVKLRDLKPLRQWISEIHSYKFSFKTQENGMAGLSVCLEADVQLFEYSEKNRLFMSKKVLVIKCFPWNDKEYFGLTVRWICLFYRISEIAGALNDAKVFFCMNGRSYVGKCWTVEKWKERKILEFF